MILLLVLYLVSTKPIRAENQWQIAPKFARQVYKLAVVQHVSRALHHVLSSLATKYLALTANKDPYAARAFAKPGIVYDSFKILVSFSQVQTSVLSACSRSMWHTSTAQVVGSLCLSAIEWPEELLGTLEWFDALNLDLLHFPSLACSAYAWTCVRDELVFSALSQPDVKCTSGAQRP